MESLHVQLWTRIGTMNLERNGARLSQPQHARPRFDSKDSRDIPAADLLRPGRPRSGSWKAKIPCGSARRTLNQRLLGKIGLPPTEHFFDVQGRRQYFVIFPGTSHDLNANGEPVSSLPNANNRGRPAQKIEETGIGEIHPTGPAVFGGG